MDAPRALRLAEGDLRPETLDASERALLELVHKSVWAPARLSPADLAGAVAIYGPRGALEIVSMLTSFHFINRIADLVGIQSDLPIVQPHWTGLRRIGVRLQGWAMGRLLDLSNREIAVDVDAALAEAAAVLGPFPPGYRELHRAPNVAAFLTTVSDVVRHLDPALVARVARAVAAALPAGPEDVEGFHPRPADPIEALAFVATRYPARTTDRMVDAVREKYALDDAELTDLFYAVSMRNGLERMNRLLAGPLPA
jgi:hypothetical protein